MLFTPYASSSRGNLYEVCDGETRILLECGLTIKRIQEILPRPLRDYAGCFVSHEHKDHARGAGALLAHGMDVYCSESTAMESGIAEWPTLHTICKGQQVELGTLRIKAFETVHDCDESLGFLIQSTLTGEKMLFATDTAFIPYIVPGLTEIAIECNFSAEQIEKSTLPRVVVERSKRTHMSLENCLAWLARTDMTKVQQIWLLHMSSAHGNAQTFCAAVRQLTKVRTIVCDA